MYIYIYLYMYIYTYIYTYINLGTTALLTHGGDPRAIQRTLSLYIPIYVDVYNCIK
jgi:hypothetical protein